MSSYLSREADLVKANRVLMTLDNDATTAGRKNPKLGEVMKLAQEAGIPPSLIINGLRGGDDAFTYLENPLHPYIVAAFVVATTEACRRDELNEAIVQEIFQEKIDHISSRPGVNTTLKKKTLDVIRSVYPEFASSLPQVV